MSSYTYNAIKQFNSVETNGIIGEVDTPSESHSDVEREKTPEELFFEHNKKIVNASLLINYKIKEYLSSNGYSNICEYLTLDPIINFVTWIVE
jgi:hypothetical protein